jgi:hypothetical protein
VVRLGQHDDAVGPARLRDHPHLSVGPLRDPATGKFVALRAPALRICA